MHVFLVLLWVASYKQELKWIVRLMLIAFCVFFFWLDWLIAFCIVSIAVLGCMSDVYSEQILDDSNDSIFCSAKNLVLSMDTCSFSSMILEIWIWSSRIPTLSTFYWRVTTRILAHPFIILITLPLFTRLTRVPLVMDPISVCQWWTDTITVGWLLKKPLILLTNASWRSDPGWLWLLQILWSRLLTRMEQGNTPGVNLSRIPVELQHLETPQV